MSFKEKDVKKYISISLWQVFYLFFLFFYFMEPFPFFEERRFAGFAKHSDGRRETSFYSRHSRAAQTLFSRIKEFPARFLLFPPGKSLDYIPDSEFTSAVSCEAASVGKSNSSPPTVDTFSLRYAANPVPAGIKLPMITFSLKPVRSVLFAEAWRLRSERASSLGRNAALMKLSVSSLPW